MAKPTGKKREDEVLLRLLRTPPKPHTDVKPKGSAVPKVPGTRK